MARRVGSGWIKDGIDGRRIEAQGFGSIPDGLTQFAWAEDYEYARAPHYLFGFHNSSYSGGGQEPRGALFGAFAAWLHDTFSGLFDMPMRDAWAEANEIVEGSGVEWAYLRATSPGASTYGQRLRAAEPTDPVTDRTFYTCRGTC